MKKHKPKLNIRAIVIAIVLLGLMIWGITKGLTSLISYFQDRNYQVEDESMYKSPPAVEEIAYCVEGEGIYLITTNIHDQAREPIQITTGDDFAPSWNTTGTKLYFLRKTETQQINVMFYNREDNRLHPSVLATFSEIDIPNINRSFIRITHDGKYVIVSSYDWGIDVWNIATEKKELNFPMEKVYQYMSTFSRNNKFFLFTVTNLYNKQFIYGVEKQEPAATLYLATADFSTITPFDSSNIAYQGYTFSINGYTFAYSKNQEIFYVDSIESLTPVKVADGSWPSIRPTLTEKARAEYRWESPYWSSFDFTNIAGFIPIPKKDLLVVATPHQLASIQLTNKTVTNYTETLPDKTQSTYMGWKLIDFSYQDVNLDQIPELLASWWPGGIEVGAERISFFQVTDQGKLREQFSSRHPHKNRVEFQDLNGDNIKELLNIYLDTSEGEPSNLENLYWQDILTWTGSSWEIMNSKFPDEYKKLKVTYENFLLAALKEPDDYGESLYLIQDLLAQVKTLLDS